MYFLCESDRVRVRLVATDTSDAEKGFQAALSMVSKMFRGLWENDLDQVSLDAADSAE